MNSTPKHPYMTTKHFLSRFFLLLAIACAASYCFAQQTTLISGKYWATTNLNVTKFRNGDPIPEVKNVDDWVKACDKNKPAWCYYDNKPENGAKYGRLYNWAAVKDPRGLAPAGWHIATDDEWWGMIQDLGGMNGAAPGNMKATGGWKENGNNSSGFNAIPGGARTAPGAKFYGISEYTFWWSMPEPIDRNYFRNIKFYTNAITSSPDASWEGMYVRCIKD